MTTAFDPERCDDLARRAAAGDETAWALLLQEVWPFLVRTVGTSRSMGRLAKSEDHIRNVVTAVVDKLGSSERRGLGLYVPWRERNTGKTFEDWLRIVTANAVRDYVRHEAGDALSREQAVPSIKRFLNEFRTSPALESLGVRPPITATQTAQQLLRFAERKLPPEQLEALRLWLDGAGYDEIAMDIPAADAEAARKLVRAAVGTLRRHFGGVTGDD